MGMTRSDRWSHTGEIVMDNILLIQALRLANGGC